MSKIKEKNGVSRLVLLTAALFPLSAPADEQPGEAVPTVLVLGTTPVLGTGIDKDKVPVNVRSFSANDIAAGSSLGIDDALARRVASVADYQGNELQPSLSLRGFNASPVLGEPQGLAVYQNGMRVNEAFGDLVNWDMIPSFAVGEMQILPGSNPVFGLNAQGGAVSMRMKNGFDFSGVSLDLAGGSTGRGKAIAEFGGQTGNIGFYSGAMALNDDGWRNYSPARLLQSYSDLGWRQEGTELGLGVTLGASYLGNNGAAPVELLDSSWSAAFTTPDNQRDSVAAFDLRGSRNLTSSLSLQGAAYFRHLRTAVANGNTSQFQDCGGGLAGFLCDENGNQLFTVNNRPVPTPPGLIAQINDVLTVTDGFGASAQLTHQARLFGLENSAIAGLSVDSGETSYRSTTVTANFNDLRIAVPTGYLLGGTNYTSLRADNHYGGLYATDTLSLTPSLALTLAGRYNAAEVDLHDQTGTVLNGNHVLFRFNPSAGLSWKITPAATLFGSYSEANRAPTPAEFSCADPNLPCRVPNAFAGDPPLKQVVSRSVEAGARGQIGLGEKSEIRWSTAGFLSTNQNDIIFVTSPTQVTAGFFENAGSTRRVGWEASMDGRIGGLNWFANYTLVQATYQSSFAINNPSNPGADANGNIFIRPGDVMPGVPLHSFKAGASANVTDRWTLGGDMVASSGVFLRGDEANLQKQTAPYALFNAETSYRITDHVIAYFRANNIFDKRFATAGVYSDGSEFGYSATDRFLTPGAPFNFWAGARITF